MATLEERVDRLEHQVQELRHQHESDHGAHQLAVGVVHKAVESLRGEVRDGFAATQGRLGAIESTLTQILARLPD